VFASQIATDNPIDASASAVWALCSSAYTYVNLTMNHGEVDPDMTEPCANLTYRKEITQS
jgi:hypothetical protein